MRGDVLSLGLPGARPNSLRGGVVFHTSLADWSLGLALGALLAMWVWIWDSPPEHIDRWRRGADGERRTARRLKPLRKDGWVAVHDLPDHGGNIDHVVVGPGGVFVRNSKQLGGEVTLVGDQLVVRRLDDPRDEYTCMRIAATARAHAVG